MASSKEYSGLPRLLKQVKPKVNRLFYRGKFEEGLWSKCVAIVGSRRMTSYGERVVEKLTPGLVDSGITIVSGFMYGIDQAAHRACLECGGKTVAVLGWGIDWQGMGNLEKKLLEKIGQTGLVVSEYGGDQPAQLWMFPQRNRIIAGLCQATVVVEAAEKSGSLITAEWAEKFNRKVLAVPGPITSQVSSGTNAWIRSGRAKMVTRAEHILEEMGQKKFTGVGEKVHQDSRDGEIMALLENEPLSIDELSRKLERRVEDLGVELSILALRGEVEEKEGKYFIGD